MFNCCNIATLVVPSQLHDLTLLTIYNDFDAYYYQDGRTPLHTAFSSLFSFKLDIVTALIEGGANMNLQDHVSATVYVAVILIQGTNTSPCWGANHLAYCTLCI